MSKVSKLLGGVRLVRRGVPSYAELYEQHAKVRTDDSVVGGGDFNLVSALMLSALTEAGLSPEHSLLDFGCGVGRLAIRAIPFLANGRYIGVEVSKNIISRAKKRVKESELSGAEQSWIVSPSPKFDRITSNSIDVIAAFSVFTHLEDEDIYSYFLEFSRISKDTSRLVASFLILGENPLAEKVFIESALKDYSSRHKEVRNVVTTRDFIEKLAMLTGWRVHNWIAHDCPSFKDDSGKLHGLGQTVAVFYKT